jgi:hypothetical protein
MSLYPLWRLEYLSTLRCDTKFGGYAVFATFPLTTAVLKSNDYHSETFKTRFQRSGYNHENSPLLAEFMTRVVYDDQDYFSTEETRFLLQLSGSM